MKVIRITFVLVCLIACASPNLYAQVGPPGDPSLPDSLNPDVPVASQFTSLRIATSNTVTVAAITPALRADSLALVDLYDSTGGPQWTTKTNWKTGKLSTWYGVTITSGRVKRVALIGNNLTGKIPASVGNLTALEWLRLQENHLHGKIPSSIGNMPLLQRLYLDTNDLTGELPASIGNLTALQYLLVQSNELSGEIPSWIGNLTSLLYLWLQDNKFTGAIPTSIGNLRSLTYLGLYTNQLTGDLPASLGNLTKLTGLAFHKNNLTGNFDWIGNMPDLQVFYFYGNPNLSCTIPPSIGNLTKMTDLVGGGWLGTGVFQHQRMHGPLPSTLSSCIALKTVYLDDSEYDGDVSAVFNGLPNLTGLYLFNNPSLKGNVATFFSGIPKLASIQLFNTGVSGTLPTTSHYSTLTGLDITQSKIKGILPSTLADAVNLTSIRMGDLQAGDVPGWIVNFSKLAFVNISGNGLGSIPDFSSHVNKSNFEYWVYNNKLDFGDLEPHFTGAGASVYRAMTYAPQQDLGIAQNLFWRAATADTLKVSTPGNFNLYQWQKQDSGGAWTDVSGATSSDLIFTSVTALDSGQYRLKITNQRATALTLFTQPVHVEVAGAVLPPMAADQRICAGQTASIPATGAGDIVWYDAQSAGTQLFAGSTYVTAALEHTATFFVSQTVDGVESVRRPVIVTVDSLPKIQITPNFSICAGQSTTVAASGDATDYSWSGLGSGLSFVVSPSAPAVTYTVTATGANGCQTVDHVTVTVNPLPVAQISPTNPSVCDGGSVTLTAIGGTSYLWSHGPATSSTKVSPATATNYAVTVTDAHGCQSTASTTVTVDAECPSPPEGLRVAALTATSVMLSWENVSPSQSAVKIERQTANGGFQQVAVVTGSLTSWEDHTGLLPGIEYTYRVRSAKGSNNSAYAETARERTFSEDQNYVRGTDVLKDNVTDAESVELLDVGERIHSWTYLDGDLRPVQQVQQQVTPAGHDLISPVQYDPLGRQAQTHLPYTINQVNPGEIRRKALGSDGEQKQYYDGTTTPPGVPTAPDNPYGEVIFEASPLSRPQKQGAPGQAWKVSGDHAAQLTYSSNGPNEVLAWRYTGTLLEATGYYTQGNLSKVTGTDEQGNQTITYQDRGGRTILQKRSRGSNLWASTYWVYDVAGHATHQVSPEAVARAEARAFPKQVLSTEIDGLCLVYTYDDRQRLISKKSPGIAPVYFVYDKWNRVVLTQDGRQRAFNQWSCIKYDRFNRAIISGLITDTSVRSAIQAILDMRTIRYDSRTDAAGNFHGYTNQAFPTSIDTVLSVTYYDDYSFVDAQIANASFNYQGSALTGLPAQPTKRTESLTTGAKTRVLNTDTFLWTVSYFDDHFRVIQTISSNFKGGVDRLSSQYKYPGWLENSLLVHAEGQPNTHTLKQRYVFDHTGRVSQTYHSIDGAAEVLLCTYGYNELGQLITKKLHGDQASGAFLQTVNYTYNIRGWLTGINVDGAAGGDRPDYYRQELAYDNDLFTGSSARFDGSVSAMTWKNDVGPTEHRYNYTYDKLGQLTDAGYAANQNSQGWTHDADVYSENSIGYDLNGNMKNLDRFTPDQTGAAMTDHLTYIYAAASNQLASVVDNATAADKDKGFKDGNTGSIDYTYDANGNCTTDANKGVAWITYNVLNLPASILFTDGSYITYTYDAAGTRLSQAHYAGQPSPTLQSQTDYSGAFVYTDNTLDMIMHEHGRYVTPTGQVSTGTYQYYLQDHLGSPRVIVQPGSVTHESLATMETESEETESEQFLYYDEAIKLNYPLFNHTQGTATQYATRLTGTAQETIGLTKSLSVMPGDVVKLEVFAKYLDPDHDSWTSTLKDFVAALAAGTLPANTLVDAGAPGSIGNHVFPCAGLLDKSDESGDGPRAFLNFLVFDRRHQFVEGGYIPVPHAAKENGTNVPHQRLYREIEVKEAGYVLAFLSNDNVALGGQPVEVYFDDFKVEHIEGPVVQINGYYPYGSEAYTYVRENEEEVKYKFQGKEYENTTGLYDFHARQYDAVLGRWLAADPAGQFASPYSAMGNNPVISVDPDGRIVWFVPIIIGAYVGAAAGIVSDYSHGNESMNGIWKGGLIGAASGAAGILAPAGILPGIGYGAATGAAIGAGGAALNGGDIAQGAKMGALTGGILGGISGGLSAYQNGANIWTGHSSAFEAVLPADLPTLQDNGTPVEYNDKALNEFADRQFGKHPGVLKLTTKADDNYVLDKDQLLVKKGTEMKEGALAVTEPTIWGGGRFTKIYVARPTFAGDRLLFLTVGHEYVHAYHYYYGLFTNFAQGYNDLSWNPLTEFGAYSWSSQAQQANGWTNSYKSMFDAYDAGIGLNPMLAQYRQNFLNYFVNFKMK